MVRRDYGRRGALNPKRHLDFEARPTIQLRLYSLIEIGQNQQLSDSKNIFYSGVVARLDRSK